MRCGEEVIHTKGMHDIPILNFFLYFRSLLQDSRTVPDSVLCEIPRPLHVLHLALQHINESILHILHCLHHLPHEIQKTILHCKSSKI